MGELKRVTDQLWQPISMFLAGLVVAGAASYFALWGAFWRESVTRPEMQQMIDKIVEVDNRRWDVVVQQHGEIIKTQELLKQEIQAIRVETGLEYGTAVKRRR